jgi:glycosyltransferase involved in cell wall biosynthesis
MQRIAIITFYNQYESKRYFAKQLAQALRREGAQVLIVDPPNGILYPEIEQEVRTFAPDFTLGFNTISPDPSGFYFWDYVRIPHLQVLVDPAFYAIGSTRSPYIFFSSVDREDCRLFQSNGVSKIFFWPHAVERNPPQKENPQRILDVVFLGTCVDFEGLRKKWQALLKKEEVGILEAAIERMWEPPLPSLFEALTESVKASSVDPRGIDFPSIFHYLDNYVRGKDRVELIRAIKEAKIHVFGEPSWNNPSATVSWNAYLKDQSNVTLYPPVTFKESFLIMQQSKVCLNSSPFFKHGSHERILNALICDAVPVTTHNGYVEEFFSAGQDLLTYRPGQWDAINEPLTQLLKDETAWKAMAAQGKEKVIQGHTWDVRARKLLEIAPQYLK